MGPVVGALLVFRLGVGMKVCVESVGLFLRHGVEQRGRPAIQINHANVLFHGNSSGRGRVITEILDHLAVFEGTARQRGDDHRNGSDVPRLLDVAPKIRGVGGVGIGLALRPLARLVVVAELNQVVISVVAQRLLPEPFVVVAL